MLQLCQCRRDDVVDVVVVVREDDRVNDKDGRTPTATEQCMAEPQRGG